SDYRWYIGVPRDEDDGHVNSIGSDAHLQIEAIEVRKLNVKYQATRGEDSGTSQELLCGSECFHLAACALDQQFERFSDRDIVIHNEHDRYGAHRADIAGTHRRSPPPSCSQNRCIVATEY